jgi:uncharacterized protein YjeT (DUF2065 family)
MNNLDRLFGFILVLDGILSLFLPADKKILWQLGRILRIGIGLYYLLRSN